MRSARKIETTPSGTPASTMSCHQRCCERGVYSLLLRTMALPQASGMQQPRAVKFYTVSVAGNGRRTNGAFQGAIENTTPAARRSRTT